MMNQSSSFVNGEGEEEEKKMVDITLKTIGPSPPFRLRVPSPITVIRNPVSLLFFYGLFCCCSCNFTLLLVHLCIIKIHITIRLHNMRRLSKNYEGMRVLFGNPLFGVFTEVEANCGCSQNWIDSLWWVIDKCLYKTFYLKCWFSFFRFFRFSFCCLNMYGLDLGLHHGKCEGEDERKGKGIERKSGGKWKKNMYRESWFWNFMRFWLFV